MSVESLEIPGKRKRKRSVLLKDPNFVVDFNHSEDVESKSPKRSFVLRHTYKLSSTAQLDQLFSLVDLEFQWEKHYYQVTGKKRQQIQEQVALQRWVDT